MSTKFQYIAPDGTRLPWDTERVCERPGCGVRFVPKHRAQGGQRYCTRACASYHRYHGDGTMPHATPLTPPSGFHIPPPLYRPKPAMPDALEMPTHPEGTAIAFAGPDGEPILDPAFRQRFLAMIRKLTEDEVRLMARTEVKRILQAFEEGATFDAIRD